MKTFDDRREWFAEGLFMGLVGKMVDKDGEYVTSESGDEALVSPVIGGVVGLWGYGPWTSTDLPSGTDAEESGMICETQEERDYWFGDVPYEG